MTIVERDVILEMKLQNGDMSMDFPITKLNNIIDDKTEIKESPVDEDYIPIIDSEDSGEIKKVSLKTITGRISGTGSYGIEEIIIGEDFPDGYKMQINPDGDGLDFDEKPTKDSANLLNSGVIYDTVNSIKDTYKNTIHLSDGNVLDVSGNNITDDVKKALGLDYPRLAVVTKNYPKIASVSNGTSTGSYYWGSTAYGGGRFVALAGYNTTTSSTYRKYSEDGTTWTSSAALPSTGYWQRTAYGNGRFVAVKGGTSSYNVGAYSDDGGETWAGTNMPRSAAWNSIAYGQVDVDEQRQGRFVAVAYNTEYAAYSDDGLEWVETNMPRSAYWHDVAYGDGMFVAIVGRNASYNYAAYSYDGVEWFETALPRNAYWSRVAYGNGRFVAVAGDNGTASAVCAYSDDGIHWYEATISGTARLWIDVAYGNGIFVAVVYNSNIYAYSMDGVNWMESTLPTSIPSSSIVFGDGQFVIIGGGYTTSNAYVDIVTEVETRQEVAILLEDGTDVTKNKATITGITNVL